MLPEKETVYHTTKGIIGAIIAILPTWIKEINSLVAFLSGIGGFVLVWLSVYHMLLKVRSMKKKETEE